MSGHNGRSAGTPNKNKTFLLKRLQDMYGDDFHPIIKMAENCVALQSVAEAQPDVNNLKAAVDAWDKIAVYTEPKLKAVEISGDADNPLKLITKVEITSLTADSK